MAMAIASYGPIGSCDPSNQQHFLQMKFTSNNDTLSEQRHQRQPKGRTKVYRYGGNMYHHDQEEA